MSLIFTYYLFLLAAAALFMALRDTALLTERPAWCIGYLLSAPLVLMFLVLNLGFPLTFLLTLLLSLGLNRLLRVGVAKTTPRMFRLYVAVWLIEAVLPLTLYFALQSRPEVQRLSLLCGSIVLVAGTLVLFVVVVPDLPRKA